MQVIGAGLPRTATQSLQLALARLLDGDCYHMSVLFANLDHVPFWRRALHGNEPDWDSFLAGYRAAVDWPASGLWRELHAAYPEALMVLSVRRDAASWWSSFQETVVHAMRQEPTDEHREWHQLGLELLQQCLTPDWSDPAAAMAAYERHNQTVRTEMAGARFIEWTAKDGWEPICRALGVAVPAEPFPHVNSRADFGADTAGLTASEPP